MKTAIIYYSKHHGNTKKLLDGIAVRHPVDLIDVTTGANADLEGYDRIGIASGVYGGSVAKPLIKYCEDKLPEGREVFYIFTSAMTGESALAAVRKVAAAKNCSEAGFFHCKGYNTFGPFKLVGGTSKGHPTTEEVGACVEFYEGLGE